MVVSNHRTTAGSMVGQESSRQHRYGGNAGYRPHHHHGSGYGHGYGYGYGYGNGNGNGNGHGNGGGNGNAQVLTISS